MSPRPLNPGHRVALVEAAAQLLSEKGPEALSTRQLAAKADTSTMAVYTYFGGMNGLVREIVYEGFRRLQRTFDLVKPSGDPVADLALIGRGYRHNAIANRHVFRVMFGEPSLGGFALSEEDRQHGRYTLSAVTDSAAECVEAGRFRPDDPALIAHQMWLGVHGTVMLEIGGYLISPYDADTCFEAQLVNLMAGAGDELTAARASVAASATRLDSELVAGASRGREPGPPSDSTEL